MEPQGQFHLSGLLIYGAMLALVLVTLAVKFTEWLPKP